MRLIKRCILFVSFFLTSIAASSASEWLSPIQATFKYSEGREELIQAISLIKSDKEQARELFEKAKNKGHPLAYVFYIRYATSLEERITLLRYAKEKKVRMSVYLLGDALYRHGRGKESDQREAFGLFLKASEWGHKDAAFYAGRMHHFGHGTEKDYASARKYYQIAVENGSARAANNLSNLHADGLGGPKDMAKKLELLEFASSRGMPMGSYNYGMYYLNDANGDPDWKTAEPYFELALKQAEGEYPEAAYQLGRIAQFNYTGKGKDYAKAAKYYAIAAKEDDRAAYHLGRFYREGLGVERDLEKALHYLKLSAKENNSRALFGLGWLYDSGKLGVPDYKTAIGYYEKAAGLGHGQAQANLGWLYWTESPDTKQEEIHRLHRKAIEQEKMDAIVNYGYLNLYRKLDKVDPKLGLELTIRAANAGERIAIKNLIYYYEGSEEFHEPDPKQAAGWRVRLAQLENK